MIQRKPTQNPQALETQHTFKNWILGKLCGLFYYTSRDQSNNLPLADNVPPVTHPATAVFVVSCFALTFSITHSAAEKMKPITAKVLQELQLRRPICFAWNTICCLAVISSCIIGLSSAPKNRPMNNPSPPPTNTQETLRTAQLFQMSWPRISSTVGRRMGSIGGLSASWELEDVAFWGSFAGSELMAAPAAETVSIQR
nr:hypothetical protein Iba_chr07bCG2880 [Ipomoea batatas]GMD17363.1 hypothetical protein Iba_chr07dCG2860 [Ipomoea batatas]